MTTDFTSTRDANGDEWPESFGYESEDGRWVTVGDWTISNPTPIYDSIVLESLLAAAPRPSLWTRTPDWAIAAGVVALFVLLVLSPWIAS